MERVEGKRVPEAMAAARWLTEVYQPVVDGIPAHLRTRLDPSEVFHEVLEHRWFLSEAAGLDVGTTAAARDYITRVLPTVPEDLVTPAPVRSWAGSGGPA
jgi:hypothetical protein